MGAEHLQQSIKGNLRDTITHLEDGLDSVRSALKTFEALPSASTNIDYAAALRAVDECVKERITLVYLSDFVQMCRRRLNSAEPNCA